MIQFMSPGISITVNCAANHTHLILLSPTKITYAWMDQNADANSVASKNINRMDFSWEKKSQSYLVDHCIGTNTVHKKKFTSRG